MIVLDRMKQTLANLMDKTAVYLGWYATRLRAGQHAARLCDWREQYPGERVLYEHELGPSSTVVDLGGFRGDFAAEIVARYGCRVLVFEPIPAFARQIEARFAGNPQVQVFHAGLAPAPATLRFAVDGESSSAFRPGSHADGGVQARLLGFDRALSDLGIERIDLLKINIEGAEFDLLEHLVAGPWIGRIDRLQVQFHDFVHDAAVRRHGLLNLLSNTHDASFGVPFVWEGWRRRSMTTPHQTKGNTPAASHAA